MGELNRTSSYRQVVDEAEKQNANNHEQTVAQSSNNGKKSIEFDEINIKETRTTLDSIKLQNGDNQKPKRDSILSPRERTLAPSPLNRPIWNPINFFSYLSFHWISSVLAKAYKKREEFSASDLYDITDTERAKKLAESMERVWEKELSEKTAQGKTPSIIRAYLTTYQGTICKAFFWLTIEIVLQILQPFLVGRLINGVETEKSSTYIYEYAIYLSLSSAALALTHHQAFLVTWRFGMRLQAGTIGTVYRKVLSVKTQDLARVTTGHVVNLISNDTERFMQAAIMAPFAILAPVQLAVITYLVWREVGWVALSGAAVMIALVPLNLRLGRILKSLRQKTAKCTDERVKIMSELVNGMRVVKMNGWEEPFSDMIYSIRQKELGYIRQTAMIKALNFGLSFVTPGLVSFLLFVPYTRISDEPLSATKAFTALAFFAAARASMSIFFPMAIQQLAEILIVFKRLSAFMSLQDSEAGEKSVSAKDKPIVSLKTVDCSWDEGTTLHLRDISFDLQAGSLLCVVGPVGCGKSTLLMTVLRELAPFRGTVDVLGRVSYCSQDAWIVSDTIEANICFGQPYDADRYSRVVKACQLEQDIETFPEGHDTVVGERGVTLSGGQRARLSLARAAYQEADVYLLDDPLSAVDAKVGEDLFTECIQDLLIKRGACVILVTHQLQVLERVDLVLALNRDGGCAGFGKYQDLVDKDVHFALLAPNSEGPTTPGLPPTEAAPRESGQRRKRTTLIENEKRQVGKVTKKVYVDYFKAGFGAWTWIIVLIFIATQMAENSASFVLAIWTDDDDLSQEGFYVKLFSGLIGATVLLSFGRCLLYMAAAVVASKNLHRSAFTGVVHSPIRYFDTNPVGRILNRFSKDLGFIDNLMPDTGLDFFQGALQTLGTIIISCVVNFYVVICVLPLSFVFIRLRGYYLSASREIRRIEAVSRSPIYSLFSNSLAGLSTIRASPSKSRFVYSMDHALDEHSRAYFAFIGVSRWFGFRLDAIVFTLMTVVTFAAVAMRDEIGAGEVGLTLVYVIMISTSFQWFVRQSAELENQMTSTERLLEFGDLPPEKNPEMPANFNSKQWPSKGAIEFKDLHLRYDEDGDDVLRGLNCSIQGGEKIGIVGRTGAGKSSIIAALFRLSPTRGTINIDGVDLGSLPLDVMRRAISVIPQEPVLFSGSVRRNIDPFRDFDDLAIWSALENAGLKETILELPGDGLNSEVQEGGSNFSVGQRQLLCLARAMLRPNKVLVLDEATANVDNDTDEIIQRTIRERFKDWTVLTIAHRLNTVLDSDRIMVVDNGRIGEFDTPRALMDQRGIFWALMKRSAVSTA
eukprot:m.53653 g.53653  ORF g.53653 m.53653 type:complete len:1321 (-) comp10876_c0_seq1:105-4067(-)